MRRGGGWAGFGWALSRAVAWATVPVFAVGLGCLMWLRHRLGLADQFDAEQVLLGLGFGAFAAAGSLVVARRPGNAVGWIMTAIGLMAGLFPALEAYAAYAMTVRGRPDALAVLGAWVNAWYWYPLLALSLVYLPLFFPDGRLPSRRWLPVAVLPGIGAAGMMALGALAEVLVGQSLAYRIDNPIGLAGMPPPEEHPLFGPLFLLIYLAGLLGAVASMIVRFRRSGGAERQQLKWFLYVVALLPFTLVADRLPLVGDLFFGLVLVALPAAIGVAVLRYRLYDIDLIIRRTLVYGVITAVLALVYFGSVVLLESLFRALAGRAAQSQLAVVASTLAIAALFAPLRRRVQDFVDRRFYRRKYDAARTLAEFAAAARDETDLDRLTGRLVAVVDETMRPESVSLWLANTGASQSGGKN